MPKLILTQCFPPELGGIETLMFGLASALHNSGEETAVYADGGADARRYDSESENGFSTRRFGGWKFLRRRQKARAAARFCARNNAAVFCDSWKSAELLPFSGAAVFAHGTEYPLAPPPQKRRRIVSALQKAKIIYAVSNAAAARAKNCGANPAKIKITPPPLIPPAPPSGLARREAEELWGGGSPRILTVGRLSPRKGIDRTIEAAAALAAEYPKLKYIVAGGGAREAELRALAQKTGAANHVRFAGRVGEELKSALYESADIFALPARAEKDDVEGFGIAYLEAAWFGLPLLGGDSGGAREAVRENETGLLCGGGADSVRDSLAVLLKDAALRRRLGEAAAARAKTQTWENRVGDFL